MPVPLHTLRRERVATTQRKVTVMLPMFKLQKLMTRSLFPAIVAIMLASVLVLNAGNGSASPARIATAPTLGTAGSFAVLGASAVTSTGDTVVTGDLGIYPMGASSVTGFTFSTPPGDGVVTGTFHAADATALQAQNDVITAWDALSDQACDTTFTPPTDIGGMSLTPGVYCFGSSAAITGTVTPRRHRC